jgi:hypothetical protein
MTVLLNAVNARTSPQHLDELWGRSSRLKSRSLLSLSTPSRSEANTKRILVWGSHLCRHSPMEFGGKTQVRIPMLRIVGKTKVQSPMLRIEGNATDKLFTSMR